jgi:hypothetical protein
MMVGSERLSDYANHQIRLTDERWTHILDHPEMVGQYRRLSETLSEPDIVIATVMDETILTYHRLYEQTPVTRKYLVVVVKMASDDAFILTAYFTSRVKKGQVIWHP